MALLDYAGLQRFFTGLKGVFAAKVHTHTKNQITDFPSSMPASDVFAWAKAKTKPTYTKSEVGLGSVDNTADANKSVKHAATTDKATAIVDYNNANASIKIGYSGAGLNTANLLRVAGYTENGAKIKDVDSSTLKSWLGDFPTSKIVGDNSTYFAGGAGPIESAHIDGMRANRLAFLPASGVTIEYSVDNGVTWKDYGASDSEKASLFSMRANSYVYAGKHITKETCTAKDQLRVTVTPVDRYCSVNMLYLWVTVSGTTATVDIERSTIGDKTTFTSVRSEVPISGWSGPNEIRFNRGTFGGGSGQTSNHYAYRFTFKNKSDAKGNVGVSDIRLYGPSAWTTPNTMMNYDHMYSWDNNMNVSFPAQLTATAFNGKATSAGVADSAKAVTWENVSGKPSTFTPATHIHNYAGSGSAGGSANSAVKLDTANAGSATQPVYFTGGKPAACTYTLGKSVPTDAKFTDTTYNEATQTVAGLMSAADKKKTDAIVLDKLCMHDSEEATLGEYKLTCDYIDGGAY